MTPRQSAAEIHALASQCYAMPVPAEQDIILFEPIITQAIADATADLKRERDGLKRRVEAELTALSDEAQKIEARYNADDYDGDLDMDELEAETIWRCVRKIRAALEAALNQNRTPQ